MITYNPDGSDLGRAPIRPITALEMQVVIPHVANMLEELELRRTNEEFLFYYAFELNIHEKDAAMLVIRASTLPLHVSWYEVDGRRLFEIRGPSGGVVSAYICYLVTRNVNSNPKT
jgi:hypothetical protein